MMREEYRKTAEDVIRLASCAVSGVSPDPGRVKEMDTALLREAAEFHLLTAVTAMALESAGVYDPGFTQAKAKAIRKAALMDAEMQALSARLDAAGIWYMPLKGAVVKDCYPVYGMRQMADYDILYDAGRADDMKRIMESLGFTAKRFGAGVHDSFYKEPVCNFEMHRALFGPGHDAKLYAYYRDAEKRLIRGDGCERRLSPEDFYVYMIAHEYKHYSGGGTGIRSLLDTYVYLKNRTPDMDYVSTETEKLGIREFEEKNRSLSLHLFAGEELTEADRGMLDYVIRSGTFGTVGHRVRNRVDRLGGGAHGKARYLLSRAFLPMKTVQSVYPFYYRHKILLPVLAVKRFGRGLTVRRSKMSAELKALARLKKD